MNGDQRRLPHEHLPHRVYVLRDATGAILYIGCTSNVTRRIADHRHSQPWRDEIDPTQTVISDDMSWEDARAVEEASIEKYEPRHNRQRTNGSRYVAAGLRTYIATEARLVRAAKTGDPAAVAAYEEWRREELRKAQEQMSKISFADFLAGAR